MISTCCILITLQEMILKSKEFLKNLRSRIRRSCLIWTIFSLVFLWFLEIQADNVPLINRFRDFTDPAPNIKHRAKEGEKILEKWSLKCFFWDMWAIWYTQYMNRCFFHAFITGKVDLDLFAFLGPWTGHRTLPLCQGTTSPAVRWFRMWPENSKGQQNQGASVIPGEIPWNSSLKNR